MYQVSQLENGLQIASAFLPEMESETIGVLVKAGGRYETTRNSGISHFLEHLLFKGTQTRSSRKIKEEIEGRGGSLNGFTTEEFTCYYAKMLKNQANIGLDVLADMVFNARLSEFDIEKERSVVIEEIKMYWDQPSSYVHDLVNELLWPRHPLGMSLSGTPQTIKRLTPQEIRQFKRRFYFPKNILIVGAGPLSHPSWVGRCRNVFLGEGHQKRRRFYFSTPVFKKFSYRSTRPSSCFRTKTTEQTHLCIGFKTTGRHHPARYPLTLLNIILGGNMSSRLFQRIREGKGLTYDIGSHLKQFHDTGALIVSAGVENGKVNRATVDILKELKKIKKEKVTRDELERAKEFYRGQLLLALEETSEQMMWLGENLITMGKSIDPKEILEKIEKVTLEEILNIAKKIFHSWNLNLAVIGPVSQSQQLEIQKGLRY